MIDTAGQSSLETCGPGTQQAGWRLRVRGHGEYAEGAAGWCVRRRRQRTPGPASSYSLIRGCTIYIYTRAAALCALVLS